MAVDLLDWRRVARDDRAAHRLRRPLDLPRFRRCELDATETRPAASEAGLADARRLRRPPLHQPRGPLPRPAQGDQRPRERPLLRLGSRPIQRPAAEARLNPGAVMPTRPPLVL